jgi:hypothetical protein
MTVEVLTLPVREMLDQKGLPYKTCPSGSAFGF